ncbi:MAG: hypothetical protein WKI04_15840 [Ferruginibacter sp.]
MKKLITGLSALLAVVSCQLLHGQTVDEVVEKNITAMGGSEKLLSLKSVKMTGSINTEGMDVGVTVTVVNGVGVRNDISVPNMGEGFQITNAEKGWEYMPFMGQSSPAEDSPDKVKSMQYLLDLPGLLVNYKEKGHQVELLGKEKVDSADCYKLKITTKSGNVSTQFIDVNTGYRVKSITQSVTAEGVEDMETKYGNFRKTSDGYMFPFSQTIARGTIEYSSIETNIPVEEKIFTN